MKSWFYWGMLLVIGLCGCSGISSGGTDTSARRFFEAEFQKWMAGQETEVSTLGDGNTMPISYDIRSIVPDEPHPLILLVAQEPKEDIKSWPAWRFNVVIEWKSLADTPIQKVKAYCLTWHPHEKRWYVQEHLR